MKDDAVIKDNEAVYLINEQTYLHLRENLLCNLVKISLPKSFLEFRQYPDARHLFGVQCFIHHLRLKH